MILAAAGADLRSDRIPNRLIAFGLAACAVTSCCMPVAGSLRERLSGMLLPLLVCWLLFRIRALGAGDIKLFALIGCLNGPSMVENTMLAAFLLGAGYAFFLLRRQGALLAAWFDLRAYARAVAAAGRALPYPGREQRNRRMHFSVAIMLGYCAAVAGETWLG